MDRLLEDTAWLRELARRLVRDSDEADDLVQETLIASVRAAPEERESTRPWLATVLRNALRMRKRGEARRAAREQVTELVRDEVPSGEELVARAQTQRMLVDLVLRLDEPYRSTVLLHVCEGVPLAEIARTQGIPASTVRWRLQQALAQLRMWLDSEAGGRKHWLVALGAAGKGVTVAQKSSKLAIVVIALLLIGVVAWFVARRRDESVDPARVAATGSAGATAHGAGGDGADVGVAGEEPPAWLVQAGVAKRRIAGRVMFHGQPVAGASVDLASLASESGAIAAPRRMTNAAGEFDFGLRGATEWSVRASATGKTPATLEIDLRDPGTRAEGLVLELRECRVALVGTVRDASGGPIAGARLGRLPDRGVRLPGTAGVESDEHGAYELCVAPAWPGWVMVEVSAAAYGSIVYTGIVDNRVTVDFSLVPEARLSGRVLRADSGEPVAGAFVWIPIGAPGIERTAWRSAFSDDDGNFRLDRIAPGRHEVFARARGLARSARGVPVVVAAGQTVEDVVISLESASTVSGTVMANGKPVAGARVALAEDVTRAAISQSDGTFVLDEVPRGTQRFTAAPYRVVKPASVVIARPSESVVLEVEPLGSITGKVVRGTKPVPDARLAISGPNERDLGEVFTNGDGRFEVKGLEPGPWTLYASNDGTGAFGRAPETVQLAPGGTADVTIELAFASSIAGRVTDQTGAPVAGVAVKFQHASTDDGALALTAPDGTFAARFLTGGGTYRASVRKNLLASAELKAVKPFPTVTLADGDSHMSDVVLVVQLDHLTIAGRVVDETGTPVPDARVVAEPRNGDRAQFRFWIANSATTSDVDGGFAISDLAAGDYDLKARAPSGPEAIVQGVAAGRADVLVKLPASASIEGSLVGFASAPQVTAGPAEDLAMTVPVAGAVTGTTFSIRGLSPGTYVVTARTSSESAMARVTVTEGGAQRVVLTSGGSGELTGRVRNFKTGAGVEGMRCRLVPRAGTSPTFYIDDAGVRTDATGAFSFQPAPAGDLVVICGELWRLYSDGRRPVTLTRGQSLAVDVPVVALGTDAAYIVGDFGAAIDGDLTPTLADVRPGGPAATAGLQAGDVITKVDGADVTLLSPLGVRILITSQPVGTKISVTVQRGVTVEVVLGER